MKSSGKANLTRLSPAALQIQHKAYGLLLAKAIPYCSSAQVQFLKWFYSQSSKDLLEPHVKKAAGFKLSVSV